MTSPEFHIASAVRSDYPELARLAAGQDIAGKIAQADAADALEEIQQLRVKARRLREINDSMLDQLSKWAGYRTDQ